MKMLQKFNRILTPESLGGQLPDCQDAKRIFTCVIQPYPERPESARSGAVRRRLQASDQ